MIRIDDSLLEELGLIALPKADRDQLLKQIYETLEMKVGMRLAERMSDQQLDEFERFIDTNDEAGALKWLESNFPDYKQVVADELEKLKVEIKRDSPKIIEAMQANPASAQPAVPADSAQSPQFGSVQPQQMPTQSTPIVPAEAPGLPPQPATQAQPWNSPPPAAPTPLDSQPGTSAVPPAFGPAQDQSQQPSDPGPQAPPAFPPAA